MGFPFPIPWLLVRETSKSVVIQITDTLKWKCAHCPRHNCTLLPTPYCSHTLVWRTVNPNSEPKTLKISIVLWNHLCFPWQKVTASEITEVRPYFLFHYSYMCNRFNFRWYLCFKQLLFIKVIYSAHLPGCY